MAEVPVSLEEFSSFVQQSQNLAECPHSDDVLFDGLGIDSLGLLILVADTEELAGVSVADDEAYPQIATVSDAYLWYLALLGKGTDGH